MSFDLKYPTFTKLLNELEGVRKFCSQRDWTFNYEIYPESLYIHYEVKKK